MVNSYTTASVASTPGLNWSKPQQGGAGGPAGAPMSPWVMSSIHEEQELPQGSPSPKLLPEFPPAGGNAQSLEETQSPLEDTFVGGGKMNFSALVVDGGELVGKNVDSTDSMNLKEEAPPKPTLEDTFDNNFGNKLVLQPQGTGEFGSEAEKKSEPKSGTPRSDEKSATPWESMARF